MSPRLPLVMLVLFTVAGLLHAAPAIDPLAAHFDSPPANARPLVWWHWVNGSVTKEGIEADLADMKRVGIAGAQMFDVSIYMPPGPVRYGTDAWHEHVQHAIATADKLGLEFHLMNTPGWSASGGPWVTPERSMKKLVWSETAVDGGAAVAITLAQPAIPPLKFRTPVPGPQHNFYRDVAVFAVPADSTRRTPDWEYKTKLAEKTLTAPSLDIDPAGCIPRTQVLALTTSFDAASGTLRATLPPGKWTLLRFGFTSTGSSNHPAVPEGHGLEIDKMDADAVSFYFDQALGRILREAGPRVGRTLKGLLFDSFEGGPQNWTDTFPAQFRTLKGYDFLPLLPVLTGRVIETPSFTEAALRDFREAVEELIAKNYFGTMRRRAHEHGMITYAEAQGGPLNPVTSNEHVDVPMNEFWLPDATPRLSRIKLVASVASVLGRPIVAAEAFTAKPEDGAWQAVPSLLKRAGDTAWTAGINRFILHHYTHQPFTDAAPGFALGRYGTHFGRLNTWWRFAGAYVDYVARGQSLLQQGHTVADIAFLQNEDHGYAFPEAMAATTPGYDFEICYPRHLAAMSWKDGYLTLPTGPRYRLLVLPDNWAAEIEALRKLRELVRAGAPVFGTPPVAPAGVKDYLARSEFDSLVRQLWPEHGRTGIRKKMPITSSLATLKMQPDAVLHERRGDGPIRHVHRRTGDADIYFVFNQSSKPTAGEFGFRIQGRHPELWNALTGERRDAPVFAQRDGATFVPLELEGYGSMFVVFRRPLPTSWPEKTTPLSPAVGGRILVSRDTPLTVRYSDGKTSTLPDTALPKDLAVGAQGWSVRFVDGRGAPAETHFAALQSWSEHADAGIRHYSGVAHYRTTFTLPETDPRFAAGAVALLDLGRVADLAEVELNGQRIGVLWQPPFRADVTAALRAGENILEVRVANRWINRLIGDESIPIDYTYQKTGKNKFTDGRIERFPAWMHDRSKPAERQRVSFATWKHYEADSPLVPSGLLGPVRLEWRREILPSSLGAGGASP